MADELIDAAENGDNCIVRGLLDSGVSPDIQDEYGDTALIIASGSGHDDIVDLLLKRGATIDLPNGYGETALMKAVQAGQRVIVNLLIYHMNVHKIQGLTRCKQTRQRKKTMKAKQNLSFAKAQDSIKTMAGVDMAPELFNRISGLVSKMPRVGGGPEVEDGWLKKLEIRNKKKKFDNKHRNKRSNNKKKNNNKRSNNKKKNNNKRSNNKKKKFDNKHRNKRNNKRSNRK